MTILNIVLTPWISYPVNLVDLILNGKHDHEPQSTSFKKTVYYPFKCKTQE